VENSNGIGKRRYGLNLIMDRKDGSSVYHPGNERSAPTAPPFRPFLSHAGGNEMGWKIVADGTSGCVKEREKQNCFFL
jgi:hypothetical protein